MKIAGVVLCVVVCAALPSEVKPGSQAGSNAVSNPFAFFEGRWHCDGKFTKSGKAISANLGFEPILDNKFLLFRHDDEPPFNYHAWSQWGWDGNLRAFVSTIQDSTGGVRLFRSGGWVGQTVEWSGGSLPDSSDQRYVFERLDALSFRVSYSYKKGNSWMTVDSSVCGRRTETEPR